jgi:hypothetical protein
MYAVLSRWSFCLRSTFRLSSALRLHTVVRLEWIMLFMSDSGSGFALSSRIENKEINFGIDSCVPDFLIFLFYVLTLFACRIQTIPNWDETQGPVGSTRWGLPPVLSLSRTQPRTITGTHCLYTQAPYASAALSSISPIIMREHFTSARLPPTSPPGTRAAATPCSFPSILVLSRTPPPPCSTPHAHPTR